MTDKFLNLVGPCIDEALVAAVLTLLLEDDAGTRPALLSLAEMLFPEAVSGTAKMVSAYFIEERGDRDLHRIQPSLVLRSRTSLSILWICEDLNLSIPSLISVDNDFLMSL